jgi:hypothetical protein
MRDWYLELLECFGLVANGLYWEWEGCWIRQMFRFGEIEFYEESTIVESYTINCYMVIARHLFDSINGWLMCRWNGSIDSFLWNVFGWELSIGTSSSITRFAFASIIHLPSHPVHPIWCGSLLLRDVALSPRKPVLIWRALIMILQGRPSFTFEWASNYCSPYSDGMIIVFALRQQGACDSWRVPGTLSWCA